MERIKIMIIQFLLFIVLTIYLLGKQKLPIIMFWIVLFLLIFTTYYIVLRLSQAYKWTAIFVLVVALSLVHIIPYFGLHYLTADEIFEAQFAQTIVETGMWAPGEGAGFSENYYGYNPVLHFLLAIVSYITGISTYRLISFFFLCFKLIYVVLFYLIASKFLHRKKDMFIATMIFIATAGFSFMGVTRRFTAGIFVMLLIFLIIRSRKPNYIIHYSLFALASFLMVAANYSVSLYFIAFLTGALAFSYLLRFFPAKKVYPRVLPRLLIVLAFFLFWELLFFDIYSGVYGEYIRQVASFAGDYTGGAPDIYRWYETAMIYFSQFIFLILSLSGLTYLFYSKLKNYEWGEHDYFLLYFSIFGLIFFVISSLMLPTTWDVTIAFMLWFFQLPLSVLAGFILNKINLKPYGFYVTTIIILILFTGSMLTGLYNPRNTNRLMQEDIVLGDDIRAKTSGLFYAGKWVKENNIDYIIADRDSFEALAGFGGAHVNMYTDNVEALYTKEEILDRPYFEFGQYPHTRILAQGEYIAINKHFARYPSNIGSFNVNMSRFDSPGLDKIYSNNQIIIYKIK